jgi:hypothetical protein
LTSSAMDRALIDRQIVAASTDTRMNAPPGQ